eukprot:4670604-Pyramimonas_sp.AAC.1
MAKKITFDFEQAADASNFLANFTRDGVFRFPDPLVPQNMLNIRIKRDQDLKARQLFLSMGRVRSLITQQLSARSIEVGSNGLGGIAFAHKSEHEAVELAHIEVNEDTLEAKVELDMAEI